ncbi:MAG TPA: histidinol-phosphate transaminase [Candidatus Faecalibacterium gallistercoris]|uniref:Histidinol-phosphate aminotransferase n=1 Tax=Candidatus Faecalibacterium gallistercoris TaxID=2838579 RepID=A0A9D2FEX8_9FIRM|nr:histidinol-phosphate transaminase [Candidatus Faecalibacterium gallistercoris]
MSRYLSPTLQDLVPYTPGDIPRRRSVLKLNTNENPYPPPTPVIEAVRRVADRLQLYPDPNCLKLRQAAAEYYELEPDQIMAGNGSDENLFFALRAFCDAGRPLARPDVTYGCYGVWCGLMHIPQHIIPLEKDFTLDPTRYYDLNETIVIANPNAPTGLALPPEAIGEIAARNPDGVVIVDEAYVDFGARSCVPLIRDHENLLVVQTFSKSRQMAGARLGFAMGNKELIADLERVRNSLNPYNVNQMTQAAGIASLQCEGYFRETCRQVIETREWAAQELVRRGFVVTDSRANFLFARTPKMLSRVLFRELRQRAVLVRYFDEPRTEHWLRITVGTKEQMEILLQRLDKILKEA